MIGMGTLVNAAAVIVAGVIGLFLKKGISDRFQNMVTQVIGLATIFIGTSGALSEMLVIQGESISTRGSMMLIISLVLGSLLGEWIDIEGYTEKFGSWLKAKSKSDGDSLFIEGFVVASLTICVGAMAIVGALNDGLTGDASMLYTKSILDFIIIIIFSAAYGMGAVFAVIPLTVLQGSVTLMAGFIAPMLTPLMIANLSLVGSVLIFCVGINLMFKKKLKIANMLPALVMVVIYTAVMG